MKKCMLVLLVFMSTISLVGCKSEQVYTFSYYDYMDTYIKIQLNATSDEVATTYQEDIDAIFKMYHDLTTNFENLPEDSIYLENVYTINQNVGAKVEIDQPLYALISYAETMKTLTDGYFDITIGKAVDIWKNVMETVDQSFNIGDRIYLYHYYDGDKTDDNKVEVNQTGIVEAIHYDADNATLVSSVTLNIDDEIILIDSDDAYEKEISDAVYHQAIQDLDALDFTENEILLETVEDKYYITLNGADAKLDLGAISKGYATELVSQYLREHDVNYFSISSGSSSIVLGENVNRASEDFIFYVSLANPYQIELTDPSTYGTIKVKNMSITTSGNYEQYVLYDGNRYHHIVSPFEKMPVQYYHTVTILGSDAGQLDALSTALFSMSKDVMASWLSNHQSELGLEVIRYNQNLTIDTFLTNTEFTGR